MCDVGYLCTNFSLPRPLCSRFRPNVRDRQTSDVRQRDVRQKLRLMPPPYRGGGIIILLSVRNLIARQTGSKLLLTTVSSGKYKNPNNWGGGGGRWSPAPLGWSLEAKLTSKNKPTLG